MTRTKEIERQSGERAKPMVVRLSHSVRITYSRRRARRLSLLLALLVAQFVPSLAHALPQGAQVTAGSAAIVRPNVNSMTINQGTPRAVVNWQSFSIGASEAVRVNQPSVSSVMLNRVVGSDPSRIYGSLSANGQVFLVNTAGVLFSRTARVDVGGLVASSLGILDRDFLDGRYVFQRSGAAGSVVNDGTIVAPSGYVALIGPQVSNTGTIAARLGSVGLAAGDEVALDLVGDGLINLKVNKAAIDASVSNSGRIEADGGRVILTADSANAVLENVINMEGVVRANSIVERNGVISLRGGSKGVVRVSGELQAAGTGEGEKGGRVEVLGDKVGLFDAAKVDASGNAGGGTVLVGGNFQGRGAEQNSTATYVGHDARISADAVTRGDGGTVIVWSDGTTRFGGAATARGGARGGDGGFVEISGKDALAATGSIDVSAPTGAQGSVLFDPNDLFVTSGDKGGATEDTSNPFQSLSGDAFVKAATLEALAAGTSITLQAVDDIIFETAVNFATDGTSATGVTMTAGDNLDLGGFGIATAGGAVTMNAVTITDMGTVNLGSGTLTLNATGAVSTKGGATSTLTAATVVKNGAGTFTVGDGSVAGAVTINGNYRQQVGTTLITANSSVSGGPLDITGGTLQLGSAAANRIADGVAVTIGTGGTLDMGSSETVASLTVNAGTVSGTGTLTAATYGFTGGTNTVGANLGAGTLNHSGGTTTLNGTAGPAAVNITGGTLQLGADNRLDNGAAVSVSGGGTLGMQTRSDTVASLTVNAGTVSGTGTLTAASYDFTGGTNTVGANLGAGTLNHSGGTTTLNGTAGAAAVNVTGGTLRLGANDRLADTAAVSVDTGGTFDVNGRTETVGSLASTGTLGTVALGAGALTLNQGGDTTYGGGLTGSGSMTKSGAGLLTLTRDNSGFAGTYNQGAGATTIALTGSLGGTYNQNGGTTTLAGTLGGTVNLNGGTFALGNSERLDNGATLTVATPVTFDLGTFTETVATFVLNGGVLTGTGGTLVAGDYNFTNGGTIATGASLGAGTLTQSGGTTTLTGSAGAATVNITGGTLRLGADNRLADAAAVSVSGAGTLGMQTFNDTVGSLAMNGGTISGTGTLTAATYGFSGGTNSVAANLGTGTLTQGGGTTTLTGSAGAATVNVTGGTLQLGANDRLADTAAVSISGGGTLGMQTFNDTVASLAVNNGTLSGSGTLTGATYGFTGGTNSVAANLGTGTVNHSGGTTTLNGTAGATSVSITGGELQVTPATLSTDVSNTGGTLAFSQAAGEGTFAFRISGAGDVAKRGGGTVVLSNAANDYTGVTRVEAGTLAVGTAGALGGAAAGQGTELAAGTLEFRHAGAIAEPLTLLGGTVRTSGDTDFGGLIRTDNGATVTLAGPGNVTVSGNIAGPIGGGAGGTLAIGKTAGALTLSGNSVSLGGLTVNEAHGVNLVSDSAAIGGHVNLSSAGAVVLGDQASDRLTVGQLTVGPVTVAGTITATTNADSSLGATTLTGNTTITSNGSGGRILLNGIVNGAGHALTVNTGGAINISGSVASLDVTAGGNVGQTLGPLTVTGATTIAAAGRDVAFLNNGNRFQGTFSVTTARTINVVNNGSLELGRLSANGTPSPVNPTEDNVITVLTGTITGVTAFANIDIPNSKLVVAAGATGATVVGAEPAITNGVGLSGRVESLAIDVPTSTVVILRGPQERPTIFDQKHPNDPAASEFRLIYNGVGSALDLIANQKSAAQQSAMSALTQDLSEIFGTDSITSLVESGFVGDISAPVAYPHNIKGGAKEPEKKCEDPNDEACKAPGQSAEQRPADAKPAE